MESGWEKIRELEEKISILEETYSYLKVLCLQTVNPANKDILYTYLKDVINMVIDNHEKRMNEIQKKIKKKEL